MSLSVRRLLQEMSGVQGVKGRWGVYVTQELLLQVDAVIVIKKGTLRG